MEALQPILAAIWVFINSPAGITLMATLALAALNLIAQKKPTWAKYEGHIVHAVKTAEKAIPNDTPNAALARLDMALQYVIKVYENANGRAPSDKVVHELKEGINLVHRDLEASDKSDI